MCADGHQGASLGSPSKKIQWVGPVWSADHPQVLPLWTHPRFQAMAMLSSGCSQPTAEQAGVGELSYSCSSGASFEFSALRRLLRQARTFSELLCHLSLFLPKCLCFPQASDQHCRLKRLFLSSLDSSSTNSSQAFLLSQRFMSNHILASPLQRPEVTHEI